MSIPFRRLMAAQALFVFLAMASAAETSEWPQFKIQLKSEDSLLAANYLCELEDLHSHERAGMQDLSSDQSFTFRNLTHGDYRITITNSRGEPVYQDFLTVDGHASVLTVQLPKAKIERPPSGPVSITHLQHPPASKAFTALVTAQRFSQAGDYRHAAEELEKAVRISPDYVEAYNNLAVQHIRLGEYSRAVEEIRRAGEIAKPGPIQLCNLAFAQFQLKQYGEAMESARASLRLDSHYAQAHYVLGALLARDPKTLGEALPHLEAAAKTLPSAESMLEMARKDWKRFNSQ